MKKNLLSILLICLTCMLFSQQPSLNITNNTGSNTITCVTPSINLTASVVPSNSSLTYSWASQAASYTGSNVSITTSGLYTVTSSNASVIASETLIIRTNTYAPQATISPSSGSITCSSPTLNLFGSGTSGIPPASGFPNSQPVVCSAFLGPPINSSVNTCSYTASTPGIYTLTVTDLNNGCNSSTIRMISDGRLYPAIDQTSQPVYFLCPNPFVTIAPNVMGNSAGFTYSWTVPASATVSNTSGRTITVNYPGIYTVLVTNTLNGCAAQATVEVLSCVGISEKNLTESKIYPNPTSGDFSVDLREGDLRVLEIYATNGSLLEQQTISTKETLIKTTDLPQGIYFIKLSVDGKIATYTKLIKLNSN